MGEARSLRSWFGRVGIFSRPPRRGRHRPVAGRGLRVEALEHRNLLAVTTAWNSATQELAIDGDDTANNIVVSAEVVSGVAYPIVREHGVVVWRGSTQSPPVTAAEVSTIVVTPGKKNDKVDLSAVALSSGFTGMASTLPVTVALGADGGEGNDTIIGSQFADYIDGGKGNDYIDGQGGDDVIYGGDGAEGSDDVMFGGAGNDTIYGGAGNDVIDGGLGDDVIYGGDGDDIIDGGLGDDVIYGGDGNDLIFGGEGNDELWGEEGDDALFGGGGDDVIYGGDGNDNLFGDGGDDTLYGGAGDDRYVFRFYPGDASQLGAAVLTRVGSSYQVASGFTWDLGSDTIVELVDGGNDTLDYSDYRGSYVPPSLPANVENLIDPPSAFSTSVQGMAIDATSNPNAIIFTTIGGAGHAVGIFVDFDRNGLFDPEIDVLVGSQETGLEVEGSELSQGISHRIEVDRTQMPIWTMGGGGFFAVSLDEEGEPIGTARAGFVPIVIVVPGTAINDAVFQRQDNSFINGAVWGNAGRADWGPPWFAQFAAPPLGAPPSSVSVLGGGVAAPETLYFPSQFGELGVADASAIATYNGLATDLRQSAFNVSGLIQAGLNTSAASNISTVADTPVFTQANAWGTIAGSHSWIVEERFEGDPTPETIDVLFDLQSISEYAFVGTPPAPTGLATSIGNGLDSFAFTLFVDGVEIIRLNRNNNAAAGNQAFLWLMGVPIDLSGFPDPFVRPIVRMPLALGSEVVVTYNMQAQIGGFAFARGSQNGEASSTGVMGALFHFQALILGTS